MWWIFSKYSTVMENAKHFPKYIIFYFLILGQKLRFLISGVDILGVLEGFLDGFIDYCSKLRLVMLVE